MKKLIFLLVIAITLISTSCRTKDSEEETPSPKVPSLRIKLDHKWDNSTFALNSGSPFVNNSGDSLTFSLLRYYISNIKLKRTDNVVWEEPESYHLVKLGSEPIIELPLFDVPTGDYSEITYTIGVDSTRNVSGAQTGALATTNNMFWTWTTGYIFLKLEGTSPQSGSTGNNNVRIHVGGFLESTNTNAVQTNTASFGTSLLSVKPNANPSLHFHVDVKKLFDGPEGDLSVGTYFNVHSAGANAVKVSKNYKHMFDFHHLHN